MPRQMVNIQTTVEMEDFYAKCVDISVLTRTFIATDPITKIRECNVYTDDGRGNGDLIFSFPLN